MFWPIHSVLHHCGSLDLQAFTWRLFFFLHLLVNLFLLIEYHSKQNEQYDNYSLYSYCNFIQHTYCLCQFPLILTNININLCEKKVLFIVFENCFSLTGRPISSPNSIFLELMVFYFLYLFSIDIDIIENHVHPLYITVDKNQEFIFLHWKYLVSMNERLVRRKVVRV